MGGGGGGGGVFFYWIGLGFIGFHWVVIDLIALYNANGLDSGLRGFSGF